MLIAIDPIDRSQVVEMKELLERIGYYRALEEINEENRVTAEREPCGRTTWERMGRRGRWISG